MIKKLALLGISALLLGGCTLGNSLKTGDAARDEKPAALTSTPTPTVTPSDNALQAVPSTATGTDDKSLETDINNTKILDEDFSDLE